MMMILIVVMMILVIMVMMLMLMMIMMTVIIMRIIIITIIVIFFINIILYISARTRTEIFSRHYAETFVSAIHSFIDRCGSRTSNIIGNVKCKAERCNGESINVCSLG